MALEVGSRLGHYDVTGLLGEGGMGQVWQATDTQLHRDVALKILPDAFAADPDRLARFQREAQVLASLNHPNIAQIHGIEESEGTRALVLELVEGPTLADRITEGPISIDEALPIAKQIAEALEAAHEAGVIHRDLKPANIKVREDGTVKVLDFGLAKALDTAPVGDPSQSPTLTAAATQQGVILGTAAYMSPEQAKGKPVDKRADVWAFGCVLFEMLTGRRTFDGDDVSEVMAGVIKSEPEWDTVPAQVSPALRTYLRRCLKKDPRERLRDIGDVRLAMSGAFDVPAPPPLEPPDRMAAAPRLQAWQRPVPALIVVLVVAVITSLAVWTLTWPDASSPPITRFPIVLPQDQTFSATSRHLVALSPDGTQLAYVTSQQIHLRPMDQMAATPVRGTEGGAAGHGRSPFFSPDGQSIGFWAESQLKKVSVSGGAPVTLCDAENLFGASWGPDDTILFGQGPDGIWGVPGTGGTPERLIPVEEGEQAHGPQMLPGGEWVLYTFRPAGVGDWDQAQIVVQSLRTGERRVLIDGGSDARYAPTGHIVYALEGTLLAAPFDPDTLTLTPGPVPLVESVAGAPASTGATHFSLSDTGSLVYVPSAALVGSASAASRRLVWIDRGGREEPVATPPAAYDWVRLSPDGSRAAVHVIGENTDVWISELARGTLTRLTTDPAEDRHPLWTPDGRRIVFFGTRDGSLGLFSRPADGPGAAEPLVSIERADRFYPESWSPDGSSLVAMVVMPGTIADIGVLPMEGERSWQPLIATEAVEWSPALSPDGRWLAYASNETGQREVYVQRFPELGDKRLVSVGGGQDPVWSPDGRELFYLGGPEGPPDAMMVVAIETDPALVVAAPELAFEGRYYRPVIGDRRFDLSPDGDRFLMITLDAEATDAAPAETARPRIHVVQHWFEELKARVRVN